MIGPREHEGRPGDEIEVEMRSRETVARWVAGHGPDVAVISPRELAVEVRRTWSEALAVHTASHAEPVSAGSR
jgi:proteasome accessory factor B